MTQTTVTMSLERYKELESKELEFGKLISEKYIFCHMNNWGGYGYYIPVSADEALTKLREELENVRHNHREMVKLYDDLKREKDKRDEYEGKKKFW